MNIKIWKLEFNLDIWEHLTVKELRVIYPITKKYADNEIEMVVNIIKAFSKDEKAEEKINSLTLQEFTQLSEKVAGIISKKK